MGKDPFEDLSKIRLPPIIDTDSRSGLMNDFDTRGVTDVIRTGITFGRSIAASNVKKQLKQRGYDPITIAAVMAAIKEGRDYEGIIAAADQAAATRARNDELRRNPPPIHGGAHWATQDDLTAANLVLPDIPDAGSGVWLGTNEDNSSLYWQGESHLLTVAPTRTGKGTMQIIPNLLRYQGSAVVLDPKGELAAATTAWRAQHVGPVHILNPFGLAPFGDETAAFNPLDQVTDTPSALKLAEMIYPRTDDDRQRFFDNEAIGFLSALLEFTACFAPTEYRTRYHP